MIEWRETGVQITFPQSFQFINVEWGEAIDFIRGMHEFCQIQDVLGKVKIDA